MTWQYYSQQKVYKRYLSKKGQELYKKRMHVAELMLQDITWNLRRIFQATEGEIQWA